jgi:hypothetical protein
MAASLRNLAAALAVFAVAVSTISAQVRTADIVGVVTDSTGSVVPGAAVVLKNLGTNQERRRSATRPATSSSRFSHRAVTA